MSSSKTMKIFQAVRSVSILSSVAGIVLFAVALNIQTLALQGKQSNLAWGYLPLVGLGYSVFWNFLSLTCLCIGSQYYFPAVSTSWPTSPLPLLSWLWDISPSLTSFASVTDARAPSVQKQIRILPSTHSLPEYEGGVWEDVELQKKEINIIEREIRGGSA
ncbi:hypothetical protein H2203_004093 [Taxawa tesnikishii (nom. ined.)]|nr:hypothetical protein H2203_004093 [Dothideales sp. JES 119]